MTSLQLILFEIKKIFKKKLGKNKKPRTMKKLEDVADWRAGFRWDCFGKNWEQSLWKFCSKFLSNWKVRNSKILLLDLAKVSLHAVQTNSSQNPSIWEVYASFNSFHQKDRLDIEKIKVKSPSVLPELRARFQHYSDELTTNVSSAIDAKYCQTTVRLVLVHKPFQLARTVWSPKADAI